MPPPSHVDPLSGLLRVSPDLTPDDIVHILETELGQEGFLVEADLTVHLASGTVIRLDPEHSYREAQLLLASALAG